MWDIFAKVRSTVEEKAGWWDFNHQALIFAESQCKFLLHKGLSSSKTKQVRTDYILFSSYDGSSPSLILYVEMAGSRIMNTTNGGLIGKGIKIGVIYITTVQSFFRHIFPSLYIKSNTKMALARLFVLINIDSTVVSYYLFLQYPCEIGMNKLLLGIDHAVLIDSITHSYFPWLVLS